MSVNDLFEKHEEEFLKFERVEKKLSSRPDLHAFIFLDGLFPAEKEGRDMVAAASHDQIYLDVSCEQCEELTESDVIELLRCGILYSDSEEGLYAFT